MLLFLCCQRRLSPGILAAQEQYQAANYRTLVDEDNVLSESGEREKGRNDRIVSSLKQGLENPEWSRAEHTI